MFTFYMDAHPLRFYKVSGRFQKFPLSLPLQLKRIGELAEMLDFRDQFHCFLTGGGCRTALERRDARFNNRCLPIAKQAMALSGKSGYLPFGINFVLGKMNDVFKIFLVPPLKLSINANIVRRNIVR